jgi:hypothetical protein
MGKTDVIDYAEICNHAKRKRECPACAELTALREENERLRKQSLIWHKWPEEKPGKSKWYLVEENDYRNNEGRPFDDCLGMVWWTGSAWHLSGLRPKRWAEIPRPNDRNPAIPPER